ncbi:MAG: alpha/beta fold hydrolase [Candidatus Tritonobacter lacicola]|nr:alpha/beta fold hydrolase [Candidatus Tritonobacter lacicola]
MQLPVTFHNKGQKLYGMVHVPDGGGKPLPAVLMCHGLGGTKVEAQRLFLRLSRRLEGEGIASLRFDLRGCGESDGYLEEMDLSDHLADLSAALEFLSAREDIDTDRIGLLGYSLGGSLASIAAPKSPLIKALVIWCAPADLAAALIRVIPEDSSVNIDDVDIFEYRGKLVSGDFLREFERYSPVGEIAGFEGSILLIHGTGDEVVLPENTEALSKSLGEGGRDFDMFLIDGADHHFSSVKWQEELLAKTISFFKDKL